MPDTDPIQPRGCCKRGVTLTDSGSIQVIHCNGTMWLIRGQYGYICDTCAGRCSHHEHPNCEVPELDASTTDQLHEVARIAADVSAMSGQAYGTVYAAVLDATKILATARRKAWQQGSVHGASHGANLQHANPYLQAGD
jgi:hypothetical protein